MNLFKVLIPCQISHIISKKQFKEAQLKTHSPLITVNIIKIGLNTLFFIYEIRAIKNEFISGIFFSVRLLKLLFYWHDRDQVDVERKDVVGFIR